MLSAMTPSMLFFIFSRAHVRRSPTFEARILSHFPHIDVQKDHFQIEGTPNVEVGPKGDELGVVQII